MHKIVKALDIAGKERAEQNEVRRAEADAAAKASAGDDEGFGYTRTTIVNVAPDVLERNRILRGTGDDSATRALKLLRTQVVRRLELEGWRTIAVLSPSANEGKTLTAINLAIAIGSSFQRTALLVDLDWRHPAVHRYFGIRPQNDIVACLDGAVELSSVLINPGVPRFCIAPCRAPVANSAERLGSNSIKILHEELRSRYLNRVVLFDLPPLLMVDDALSFLPNVDCALLVIEEGRTKKEDISRALELIDPARLLGTVINKSSQSLPGY